MKIQFTLFCSTGAYTPLSTVVDIPVEDFKDIDSKREKSERYNYWRNRAINRICAQRYKTGSDLAAHSYTILKYRIYDEAERKAYNKKKFLEKMQNKG